MLLELLTSGYSIRNIIVIVLLTLPTLLISLTFHEVAHGYVAYKFGDPTAKNLGRLTLNPSKHLDPIGTLCMLFVGFGWAKPVPINSRYFKKPKSGMALTAAAGPIANLLLSIIGVIFYKVIFRLMPSTLSVGIFNSGFSGLPITYKLCYVLLQFFNYFIYLNVSLAVFNLIPIPPFDGSRLAFVFLPDRFYWGIMKYERIILIIVLVGLSSGILRLPFSKLTDLIVNGEFVLISLII